jgi:group I intron endonuclease
MMNSGVYIIRNVVNGRLYVGSAADVVKRWGDHRRLLSKSKHHNPYLQHAWGFYGAGSFEFVLIETVGAISDLLVREQFWLDHFKAADREFGYNIALVAGAPMRGRKHSPATKARHSQLMSGRKFTTEHKARIGASNKGKNKGKSHPHGREWREKIGAASTRSWGTPEYRAKMCDWNGKKHKPESIVKIGAATQKRWEDPEFRAKHSEGMKRWNAERERRGQSAKDRERSNRSIAAKLRWQDPEVRARTIAAQRRSHQHESAEELP